MRTHLQLAESTHRPENPTRPRLPIRVVLADGHAAVRRSLRRLIEAQDDLELLAEVDDFAAAMLTARERAPDVLVLDLPMPKRSRLEAIGALRARVPGTAIVVLTMQASPLLAQQILAAGAVGFVLTDRADTELPDALRGAAQGREYVSPVVATGLEALRRAADTDGLSPRETEIVRLVALGHTSTEIAAELDLSRRTVETHRARIYRELGIERRSELVRFALGRHLIGD